MDNYKLILRIKNVELTPKEYINISKDILLALEEFDDVFKNFFGWGKNASSRSYFKSDKSDFEQIVFGHIKDEEIVYYNTDKTDKEMRWDSKSRLPYTNSYSNTTKIKEGQITITFSMGSINDKLGNFLISFPKYNYPKFSDRAYVELLFKKCLSMFEVEYGVVISNEFRNQVKLNNHKRWVGWMTYFKDVEIYNVLPAEIEKEIYQLGTLFTMSKDRPDSNNKQLIKKTIEISELLQERGCLDAN